MKATRVCRACGHPIPRKPKWTQAYYATRQYCDRNCQAVGRPAIAHDYKVTDAGCWEWLGHIDRNGYGKAYDPSQEPRRRIDWAHRVSYRTHRGPIPEGYELDHTCRNTICINPDHLDVVTKVEHARRTMERAGKDELHQKAAHLRETGLTYREIGEALGMLSESAGHSAVKAAIRKGLVDPDSLPPVPRLTDAQREDIRGMYALGIPQGEIAAWYRIDSSHVSRVVNGKTSGHATQGGAA